MRTLGSPSASTVASDMAVGSRGSPFTASSNQAANSRNGSSASVKSPVVNQVGCSIGADSDILRSTKVVVALAPSSLSRPPRYRARSDRWHAACGRLPLVALALALGGCSLSYQLDTVFTKKADAEVTGSLRPTAATSELPAEGDLAMARAAVTEVLAKGGR